MATSSANTKKRHEGTESANVSSSSAQNLPQEPLLPTSLIIFILSSLTLLRILVGYQPHSGQDNYHGKESAYGGDYEAQRHWMELTLHLPMGDWYKYDLQYWGLDYPPLTAYISYICGIGSSILVGPETMTLFESRGYEDPIHKSYMRGTVLVLDLLIYYTALWTMAPRMCSTMMGGAGRRRRTSGLSGYNWCWVWIVVLGLAQPSIILIDHGHFQYNTVSLGLALWSFHYMTKGYAPASTSSTTTTVTNGNDDYYDNVGPFRHCIVGSILFCLSLNFKQMTLYYAPAVFAYLLGRCFVFRQVRRRGEGKKGTGKENNNAALVREFRWDRFLGLGITVILTFVVLWWPFVVYPSSSEDDDNGGVMGRILHVVGRMFPFQRGLFEGKVSNLWCALSTKPFSIRKRLPETVQPVVALVMTFILMMPACVRLFDVGRGGGNRRQQTSPANKGKVITESKSEKKTSVSSVADDQLRSLLWGTFSTALAFFLASFQVHEKSILMAVTPASLLLLEAPMFTCWFSIVAMWTLWPLIQVDRLEVAYVSCMVVFSSLVFMWSRTTTGLQQTALANDVFAQSKLAMVLPLASTVVMAGLHVLELIVPVPAQLPDLFPVLWSIGGCGMFVLAWVGSCWSLFRSRNFVEDVAVAQQ